jgi:FlaA1/EpsC-like NDP-sugar epimerase
LEGKCGENLKRILCTGAGGPAGINFAKSLEFGPEKMIIVGTEANKHYLHLAPTKKKYLVPRAKDPSYVDR